ncbi:MAG TPA: hypothetical protein VEJ20_09825 [Candidatus Eremiobacteraceae bacterium]|nr:hypothetical protein [Candidatus Eremiobacteraceae bacterium]
MLPRPGWIGLVALGVATIVAACSAHSTPSVVAVPQPADQTLAQRQVRTSIPTVPPGSVVEYPIPTASSFPAYITYSSVDGDLWFTEATASKIGRVDPGTGTITETPLAAGAQPYDITIGPDGAPWFGAQGLASLGRLNRNVVPSYFAIPGARPHVEELATDLPQHAIWFADSVDGSVDRFDVSGHTFSEYSVPMPAGGLSPHPVGVAIDTAGHIWYSDYFNDQVGEFSSDGTFMRQITLPGSAGVGTASLQVWYMTLGPDNDIWVIEISGGSNFKGAVARIDPFTLDIKTFPAIGPGHGAVGLASGPNGLWTPLGGGELALTNYTGTTEWEIPNMGGYGITEGPDGTMWFIDWNKGNVDKAIVSDL